MLHLDELIEGLQAMKARFNGDLSVFAKVTFEGSDKPDLLGDVMGLHTHDCGEEGPVEEQVGVWLNVLVPNGFYKMENGEIKEVG